MSQKFISVVRFILRAPRNPRLAPSTLLPTFRLSRFPHSISTPPPDQAKEQEKEEGPSAFLFSNINDDQAEEQAKEEGPSAFSFSNINDKILRDQFKIVPGKSLVRQGKHVQRATKLIGQNQAYMTSSAMYQHFSMLENMILKTNEAGARLWIDPIFFRASAILSDEKHLMLNVEQHFPSISVSVPGSTGPLDIKVNGMIDYAAFTTDKLNHKQLIRSSHISHIKHYGPSGFFVTEAKRLRLNNHVPQAVAEMFATAKYFDKTTLRGAVTNGHEWMFIILYLNKDGVGGTYHTSPTIKIRVTKTYPFRVRCPGPDIVAGIVAYWVEHSFTDLNEDDWFCHSD